MTKYDFLKAAAVIYDLPKHAQVHYCETRLKMSFEEFKSQLFTATGYDWS